MNRMTSNRRTFLQTAFATGTALGVAKSIASKSVAAEEAVTSRPGRLKISAVETFLLEHTLPKAIGPSTAMYRKRTALLVKISTAEGLVGLKAPKHLMSDYLCVPSVVMRLFGYLKCAEKSKEEASRGLTVCRTVSSARPAAGAVGTSPSGKT